MDTEVLAPASMKLVLPFLGFYLSANVVTKLYKVCALLLCT